MAKSSKSALTEQVMREMIIKGLRDADVDDAEVSVSDHPQSSSCYAEIDTPRWRATMRAAEDPKRFNVKARMWHKVATGEVDYANDHVIFDDDELVNDEDSALVQQYGAPAMALAPAQRVHMMAYVLGNILDGVGLGFHQAAWSGMLKIPSLIRPKTYRQNPARVGRELRGHYEGEVGCAIVLDDTGRSALILQRGPTAPWKPLHWNLPGGVVERGETALDAARRELAEETGLRHVRPVSREPVLVVEEDGWLISFFVFAQTKRNDRFRLDYRENVEYTWTSRREIDEYKWAAPSIPRALKRALGGGR